MGVSMYWYTRRKITVFLLIPLLFIFIFSGCRQFDVNKTGTADVSIYKKYTPYFSFGFAVGPRHLRTVGDILTFQANRLTAENAMKFGPIHPAAGKYNFGDADRIAGFARRQQMTMTGHTFVWHRQTPSWLFAGLTPGNTRDIEILKSRLKNHIETLIARYGDVVDNWDVVNEAVSDTYGQNYRDADEGSAWYKFFASEEYIYWAYKYAADALAAGGSSAKLYYNDYNVTVSEKLGKILAMVKWLRSKGARIDGIGLQGHWKLDWPSTGDIKNTISRISRAGLEIKISELDISVYSEDDWASRTWEKEKPFTDDVERRQARRYRDLFNLFRDKSADISSVTLWGVSDDATWLDTYPIRRNDYPLLFDDAHKPKLAYFAIVDF